MKINLRKNFSQLALQQKGGLNFLPPPSGLARVLLTRVGGQRETGQKWHPVSTLGSESLGWRGVATAGVGGWWEVAPGVSLLPLWHSGLGTVGLGEPAAS